MFEDTKEIIVTNQKEFEKIELDFKGVIKITGNLKQITARPNAEIRVSGSAVIKSVYDSAVIEYVYDSAVIESVSGSAVIKYVYDSAVIKSVYDSAVIEYVSG